MFESILFYLFGAITLLSAIMVISSRNPVHSVLFLILAFCGSSGLLILIEAEFMAMIFIVLRWSYCRSIPIRCYDAKY
jgi:NADH-quinone oxidoreductase subunit J